jgi:hypothetical protein
MVMEVYNKMTGQSDTTIAVKYQSNEKRREVSNNNNKKENSQVNFVCRTSGA